ncbi:MAG: hypothetical protein V3R25_09230 [Nitrosomonadaceae bacterium]
MTWVAVAVAGAAVVGAVVQTDASKRASRATGRASSEAIQQQQLALEDFRQRTQPFSEIGLSAAPALQNLLGLTTANPEIERLQGQLAQLDETIAAGPEVTRSRRRSGGGLLGSIKGALTGGLVGDPITGSILGARGDTTTTATEQPFDLETLNTQRADLTSQISQLEQEDTRLASQARPLSQLEEINPLVSFLRDEGFEDIQESAAARGRLGAGGTLQDLTRFNTQLASTVVPQLQQQRFNQLFNVLGLGANAATGQGTAGLQTAGNIGNLQLAQGQAQAQGAINQGNVLSDLVNQGAGIFGAAQGGAFRGNQNALGAPQQPLALQQQPLTDVANPNRFEAFS